MADATDNGGRITAHQTLTIIFILAILIASVCPIATLLKRHGMGMDVRRLFVVTLTMGGILIALFPLVIKAHLLFDSEYHVNMACGVPIMATIYESFYYPFVYSTGLILIAIHMIVQQKTNCLWKQSPLSSFFIIIMPWLLGLVLILPIMLSGIQWDRGCQSFFSTSRLVAQIWICLIPVIGVVVAGIAVLLFVKTGAMTTTTSTTTSTTTATVRSRDSNIPPDDFSAYQVSYVNGPQSEVSMTPTGTLHRVGSQNRERSRFSHATIDSRCSSVTPSIPPILYDLERERCSSPPLPPEIDRPLPPIRYDYDRPVIHQVSYPDFSTERPASLYHYRYPHPHSHPYLAPIHSPSPPPYPFYSSNDHVYQPNMHNNVSHFYDPIQTNHPPIPPPPSFRNPPATPTRQDDNPDINDHRRDYITSDKKVFLRVMLIFFLCSFPAQIFNLYSLNNDQVELDTSTLLVIMDFIYWITIVRWLVLPLLWWFMK